MNFFQHILRQFTFMVWLLLSTSLLFAQNEREPLSLRDKATITYVAKNHIQNEYAQFLGLLASGDLPPQDIEMLIARSSSSSFGQIFYNDKSVIEDNLDPSRNQYGQTQDLPIGQYLNNLVLFFAGDPEQYEPIKVTNLRSSAVREAPFVNIDIAFDEQLFGTHKDKGEGYQKQTRVATLRAVKDGRDWKTFIVNVVYQDPEVEFVEAEIMPEETSMAPTRPDSTLRFASEGDSLRFEAMMRGVEENLKAQQQQLERIIDELEANFEAQESRNEEKYQDLVEEGEGALKDEDLGYAEKLFRQAGAILPFQLDHYRGLNQLRRMKEESAREEARITREFSQQLDLYRAYEKVRAYQQAFQALEEALSLRPTADSLKPRLQRLEQQIDIEQGELTRFNAGDFAGSVDYFDDRIKQDAQNPFFFLSRGMSYVKLEKRRQALKDFESALSLAPNYKAVYLERAKFLTAQQKYNEALPDYNEAVRLDPTDPVIYASRAELRLILNDQKGALNDLGTAIERGKRPEHYIRRGELHWDGESYEQARKDFSAAIRQDSSLSYAWFRRGLTYEVLGKLQEAGEDFLAAKFRGLESVYQEELAGVVAKYVTKAVPLSESGELAQAVELYQQALVLDPTIAKHWYELGQVFWKQQDRFSALDAFEEALDLEPEMANVLVSKGQVLMELVRFEESLSSYEAALKVDPKKLGALVGAGKANFALGNFTQAVGLYEQAIEGAPDNMLNYFDLGRTHLALKSYELAVSAFDAAEKLDRKHAGIPFYRAKAYAKMGELKTARKDLDKALSMDASKPEVWILRAEVQQQLGDKGAALRDYSKALELDSNPSVRLERAKLAYDLGFLREAGGDLSILSKTNLAKSMPVLQLGAYVSLRQGQASLAKEQFEALLERDASLSEVHFGLALSLAQMQELEAAKAALAQAFRLGSFTQRQVKSEPLLKGMKKDKSFKKMYQGLPKK